MTPVMPWAIVGSAAALCTMLGFIPQIVKVARTRSSHDVSIGTILQLGLGVSLWIAYGLHLGDWIIVVANSVTLISLLILLSLYLRYR